MNYSASKKDWPEGPINPALTMSATPYVQGQITSDSAGAGAGDFTHLPPYDSSVYPSWQHPGNETFVFEPHPANTLKETNPKDAVGIAKVPMSTVPSPVLMEVGLAMMEGARKYGRHNYRVAGIRASVYYDAGMRHLMDWWEGQDTDPASGLSHITKAIATLVVLRDAMMNQKWEDDRPPAMEDSDWMTTMNAKAKAIIEMYPDCLPAFTNKVAS